jgi:hypothetical protein
LTRFWFFFKKKFGLVTFFDKNRIEPKMITPTRTHCCFTKITCRLVNYVCSVAL